MTTRAAFLRTLPRHGFAPPAADVAALGGDLPAGNAADRFAADVRAFAAAFWALPPADRRARWAALTARAAGPAAAWLAELNDALDVTAAAHADPAAAEVAAAVRELAVLGGSARAVRRRAWLAHAPDRFAARRRAARVVIRDDLALARLEPTLFDYLATGAPPSSMVGTPSVFKDLFGLRLRSVRRALFVIAFFVCCLLLLWFQSERRFESENRPRTKTPTFGIR